MPASQEVSVGHGLKGVVVPDNEPEHVFFTDQKPGFRIKHKNKGRHTYKDGSSFVVYLMIHGQEIRRNQFREYELEQSLEPGEECEWEFGGGLLGYEGHGIIGFGGPTLMGRGGSEGYTAETRISSGVKDPAYTFSIWDRSQYMALHTIPLRWQRRAFWLSVALLAIAVAQIMVSAVQLLGIV